MKGHSEIKRGDRVRARTYGGELLPKVALTEIEARGHSFPVIWVARPEEWAEAEAQGRQAGGVPWPAEDVERR